MAGQHEVREEPVERDEKLTRSSGDVKSIEDRLRFYSLLVENSLDLILVADADGTARFVNPPVEKVLGYTPKSSSA